MICQWILVFLSFFQWCSPWFSPWFSPYFPHDFHHFPMHFPCLSPGAPHHLHGITCQGLAVLLHIWVRRLGPGFSAAKNRLGMFTSQLWGRPNWVIWRYGTWPMFGWCDDLPIKKGDFPVRYGLNNQGGTKSFCCEIAGIWCEHVNHCKLQIWGWHGVDSHIFMGCDGKWMFIPPTVGITDSSRSIPKSSPWTIGKTLVLLCATTASQCGLCRLQVASPVTWEL